MSITSDKTTITIKIDREIKNAFAELCENLGIPVSSAVIAMMKQAVRKQELKISTLDINGFTPSEAAELKRRADDVKAGRIKMHSLIEA
ncbi:MAG: type II toxin-antitoxin system RelB/DinJ family antitoxin [Synergistaceae bacterium]|nr:type II toxin-antitoxin system RelB/DinJ family antitoxin [Synergistaceae bacterium]